MVWIFGTKQAPYRHTKPTANVSPKVKPQIGEKVIPFRDPSKVVPFKRPVKTGKGTVIEGDASQRTVDVDFEVVSDQNILERVTSLLNARRLRKFSKEAAIFIS